MTNWRFHCSGVKDTVDDRHLSNQHKYQNLLRIVGVDDVVKANGVDMFRACIRILGEAACILWYLNRLCLP